MRSIKVMIVFKCKISRRSGGVGYFCEIHPARQESYGFFCSFWAFVPVDFGDRRRTSDSVVPVLELAAVLTAMFQIR
jgi:hypothetical protein